MVRIKIQPKGLTLASSAAALAMLCLVFHDIVLSTFALIAALMLVYCWFSVVFRARWIKRNCRVNPESLSLKLVAGTVENARVVVEAPRQVAVKPWLPFKFCSLKSQAYLTNSVLSLEFSPRIAGVYSSECMELALASPLNAFEAWVEVPFKAQLTVVPRVVPVAVRALTFAASLGRLVYEVPLQILGRGTEYAETREYLPGDDLRRLDWKATARLQKLMVKRYYQEAGGPVNIVFDAKASGPVSRDRAAAQFLNLALAIFGQGSPAILTVVDAEGVARNFEFRDPRTALLKAVDLALKAAEVDYGHLYEFMDPQSAHEAVSLLKVIGEAESQNSLSNKRLGEVEAVTCLVGDLTWLLSLHEDLKAFGGNLRIHVPSGAWIDAPNLEQAYMEYERQLRIIASMMKNGVEVKFYGERHGR